MVRTPQRLTTKQGEPYYRVRYRRGGQQRALSFYGPTGADDADEFVKLIAAWGVDRAVDWWNAHLEDEQRDELTLDQWFAQYLESLTGLTAGTRLTYDRTYRRVWSGPLGSLPLAAIGRPDVARVVNDLSATKSDKTVRNAFGVLTSALKIAAEDGHIPANPISRMRLPRRTEHTETEMRFLNHDEWERLIAEIPAHYRPLFVTLVGTGIRWGEAEALTVGDYVVGSTGPSLRISKAAKWNASKATREVGPTKTKKSRRTVTLPPEVVEALSPLLDRPGQERLFLAPRGGPLRHRTVYDDWKAAIKRAGLEPQPRIHDLRHTHVAWLIAAGIPLVVIQRRLGHEQITTTMDRYGHLLPELEVAAAEAASLAMRARPQLSPAGTASALG